MNKNSRFVRSATFAAIAGLSLTVGGSAAMAQESPDTTEINNKAGNSPLINKEAIGALTIHKKADPEGKPGDPTGNYDGNVSGEDLDGVGFTIYKVKGADLTTNDGLKAASKLKAAELVGGNGKADMNKVELTNFDEQFTNNKGEIITSLTVGVYLVMETTPKAGYSPAAPFVVFLPMTQGNEEDGGEGGISWNYNVHAYPKNYAEKLPEKVVKDTGKNLGDEITYTVTAYAQTIDTAKQSRTKLEIKDNLDAKVVAPEPKDVTVEDFEPTDYEVKVAGQEVTVTFTENGLQKVNNGQKIDVKIPAKIKSVGDGDIKNKAVVIENDPNTNQDKEPKETPEVHTYLGGVQFKKVEVGTETGLKDAEFLVYGVKEDQKCDSASVKANLLDQMKVNGKSDPYVSGEDGTVTIEGLHVNDFADGQQTPNLYKEYCLVETKSPKGYELLVEPVSFEVLKEAAGGVHQLGETGKIENIKDTTPKLPMTGGAGVGILAAIGAAIVAAGAWFARRNSNKA